MNYVGILLDTSFLVALSNAKDENRDAAQALKGRIAKKELGQSYLSDYIFDEFVTFLKARHVPQQKVREIGDALLSDSSIQLLKVDSNAFLQSWEMFKKFDALSFTDCTTVILAGQFGIKSVASFDADFDGIGLIKRIQA